MAEIERDEDGFLIPKKHGTRRDEYGESWLHWAVFDRAAAQAELASDELDFESENAAFALTGWWQRESGPGRAFAGEPWIVVKRNHVLVKQAGGLDI
jgi:hypothetical protein